MKNSPKFDHFSPKNDIYSHDNRSFIGLRSCMAVSLSALLLNTGCVTDKKQVKKDPITIKKEYPKDPCLIKTPDRSQLDVANLKPDIIEAEIRRLPLIVNKLIDNKLLRPVEIEFFLNLAGKYLPGLSKYDTEEYLKSNNTRPLLCMVRSIANVQIAAFSHNISEKSKLLSQQKVKNNQSLARNYRFNIAYWMRLMQGLMIYYRDLTAHIQTLNQDI